MLTAAIWLSGSGATAQELGALDAARVPEAVPGVAPLFVPSTPAALAAAMSANTAGTQFRATLAPLQSIDVHYVEVLSEVKLSLLSDTSTSLTQGSLTVAFNPFSLRGYRADTIMRDSTNHGCGSIWEPLRSRRYPELREAGENVAAAQERARKAAANTAEKTKAALDALTKVSGDPDDPSRTLAKAALEDRSLSQAEELQAEKELHDAQKSLVKAQTNQKKDASEANKGEARCETGRVASEWPRINGTWIPMVSLTGLFGFYPSGTVPDPADATGKTVANLEPWGGEGVQLVFSFHPMETAAIDLSGTYQYQRASGQPHTFLENYFGAGVTASWLFIQFLSGLALNEDRTYARQGFLPGLAAGVSGQVLHCDGGGQCIKMRPDQESATPFLDVRVAPTLQVRFAVPIVWYSAVDKSGRELVPTLTIAGAVGSL